jgi:hypothetical protein
MRDNAMKKRDERILDLWRKDQMQPSVLTLVNKMIAEKNANGRNDWDEDNADEESLNEQDMGSIGSVNDDKIGPSINQ